MTTLQLNAEILRNLGALAEDESMLKRVAKYLRKLVAEKKDDPTFMPEEDFFRGLAVLQEYLDSVAVSGHVADCRWRATA